MAQWQTNGHGTVVGGRVVHGHSLLQNETKVLIDSLCDEHHELLHPVYGYEICRSGFTQWVSNDLCLKS